MVLLRQSATDMVRNALSRTGHYAIRAPAVHRSALVSKRTLTKATPSSPSVNPLLLVSRGTRAAII